MCTLRRPAIPFLLASTLLSALLGCGGCGEEPASPDAGTGTNVAMTTSPISRSTVVPFFSMGHEMALMPYGGIGVINTGSSWTASIDLVDIPEGKYVPRYDGYGVHTMSISGVGAVQGYCQLEWGTDITLLSVVSGGANRAEIMLSNVNGCTHVAVDRFITNPGYAFDPQHRWAGARDGENIIAVYADDLDPFSDLALVVCDEDLGQDCTSSPFGIFPDLPEPPDTAWPDPASWEDEEMLIPSDSHGDVAAYLVLKPGRQPTSWSVRFEPETGAPEEIYLRVSNLNAITLGAP